MFEAPKSPATASLSDWLGGVRPHTRVNASTPVIVGVGAALTHALIIWRRVALMLVVVWAPIMGVDFANDYSDGIRGTDDDHSDPLRLTGSGLVEPKVVKYTAFDTFGIAGPAGVVLFMMSAWWLVLVGVLCIAAVWFYVGDKNSYGYRGLGEVSVFVFFDLVAMLGTEFTQAGSLSWVDPACMIGIGLVSSAVNLVNNLRDIPTDIATGRIALAVRLGDFCIRIVWQILSIISVLASIFIAFWRLRALVGLLIMPLWVKASEPIRAHKKGKELIPVLGLTGKMTLAWSVITVLAFALS